ncbi:MAG TPA: ribosome assembly factor SBDS [Candidatus Nanoarchaeia archaeon]|nr:ribosome assembly factor SBDS [Candidatus Nanoarchaeia archaeon]
MVSVDSANTIKLKTHGQSFEILADSTKALAIKHGTDMDIRDVLAVQKVFTDSRKGLEASPNALKAVFGTDDPLEAAKLIIQKGDIPLTQEYKQGLRDQKKKQIIYMIHRNAVDPKTHLPHPPQRIEAALEEAKFHIDEFKEVTKQVEEALKAIRPILPIKFETKEISAKIPPNYAAKSYSILHSFGKTLREDWQSDGSLVVIVEIPGGLEEEFHSKLNALCHGEVETKILNIR